MEKIDKTAQKPSYEELFLIVEKLKFENAELRRLIYGQKSERFVPVPKDQLAFPNLPSVESSPSVSNEQVKSYSRKKRNTKVTPHGRNPLPEHLPRIEEIIEPEGDTSNCKRIGQEITETLEYKKAELYVRRIIRPKYAKEDDDGIVIADMPSVPLPKCQAGASLLSHILISKYVDHLPFYRIRKQFKRAADIDIPASTISGWFTATSALLEPLGNAMRLMITESSYVQVDETPLKVQDPMVKGKCHNGYMWPYFDPVQGICVFDYRPGRGRAGPDEMLKSFSGALQADGYDAYHHFEHSENILLLGCFAHARRYFEKALDQDKERASWMLTSIQKLYRIEKEARDAGMSHIERYRLRQEKSVPVLADMKKWLDQNVAQVLPRSLIGKAINYALGMWKRLERYVTDGRFEIDNNLIENAIRPIALGRKNYLFSGSHDAARHAALIYSLMATAAYHEVDPSEYLKFVINNISDHPWKHLSELLPQNWKN